MNVKNRFFSLLLAVSLFVSLLPLSAAAADNGIYYTCGGFLSVNRYTGTVEKAVNLTGDLVIPETVEGIRVISIADSVFYGNEGLTSVTVPSSVQTIGDGAFGACTSLKSVKLGEGVTSLGKNAFRYCYSLTDVSLPSTLTALESYSFASCLALKSITIPSEVTSVGSYAFSGCKSLEKVSLPAGITTIGDYAFSACTSLQSISLPQNIQEINTALFNGCTALSKVTVPASVKSVGKSAFGSCTALKEMVLPEGVEKIYDWAFNGCKNLTSLSMPDSIKSIGVDSFYGCENITFLVNAGSYSQVFASANDIPFKLGTAGPDDPDIPDDPETPFTDIKTHWAKSYIEWAYAKGYFKGITDTKFGPDVAVNRAMIVSVLYRIEGEPSAGKSSFSDVPEKAYYAAAVAWGETTGVVSGMGEGKFAPTRNITREQLATMLYRYAQYKKMDTSKKGDLTEYKDHTTVSSYANAAMTWAVGAGVVTGRTGATLDPKGNATRAEAAAMLQRFEKLS